MSFSEFDSFLVVQFFMLLLSYADFIRVGIKPGFFHKTQIGGFYGFYEGRFFGFYGFYVGFINLKVYH